MDPAITCARRTRFALLVVAVALSAVAGVAVMASGEGSAPVEAPLGQYDPIPAGEDLPAGYRVGLPRDQIQPVYDPQFTTARNVDWPDDSLVIGVAGDSEAKAYPVTHLNSREMVIDSLEGIPILVTW